MFLLLGVTPCIEGTYASDVLGIDTPWIPCVMAFAGAGIMQVNNAIPANIVADFATAIFA